MWFSPLSLLLSSWIMWLSRMQSLLGLAKPQLRKFEIFSRRDYSAMLEMGAICFDVITVRSSLLLLKTNKRSAREDSKKFAIHEFHSFGRRENGEPKKKTEKHSISIVGRERERRVFKIIFNNTQHIVSSHPVDISPACACGRCVCVLASAEWTGLRLFSLSWMDLNKVVSWWGPRWQSAYRRSIIDMTIVHINDITWLNC